MTTAFAFLDSSFEVSQHLQMLTFSSYAKRNNISIKFYGCELVGFESRHDLLLDYLSSGKHNSYLFFSITQFSLENYILDIKLLKKFLDKSIKIHFSNEQIKVVKESDLVEIQLLLFSKREYT